VFVISSIRNIGCSIVFFFPSIPRVISNPLEENDVVIYSSKNFLLVVSLSYQTFAFSVGLCVDDGNRPGLRIHL
jgi:hypothetical protein